MVILWDFMVILWDFTVILWDFTVTFLDFMVILWDFWDSGKGSIISGTDLIFTAYLYIYNL